MLTCNYVVIPNVILPRHCLTDLIQVPYLNSLDCDTTEIWRGEQ